ncbi:MAG: NAD(P)(+) transhydrogenase (Re/Si-specific) subunit beta [Candidatus Hinthialibacter antarcticus]|nr:NAD(P)(+) transhydrogenase (Re/Si-specific) subunit beta [Candidatus Hinthialibacter antarcticus]
MRESIINLAYLLASILFIMGLKGLTHPRTAVRGNILGSLGMLLAIVVTLFDRSVVNFEVIIAGVIVGSVIGAVLAVKIQMTAMPQLVALFNGFGGGASVFVAGGALMMLGATSMQMTVSTALSGTIGAVTFTGSLIAFAKLQELLPGKPIRFPGVQFVNLALLVLCIALTVLMAMPNAESVFQYYWIVVIAASILGVLFVLPVGGADMPVIIAFLNSCSGLAAAATGFVLNNNVLIVSGSLVGASGVILTAIMCKAMNRSLANVFFVGMGDGGGQTMDRDEYYEGKVKATSADEVAMLMETAQRVVIVPGYGMAVAQAQHAVRDITNLLEARGAVVEFAIHPVAGRMPGHMNVLLAEADIPYDKLKEMDEINPSFANTDVTLVIGANDVVNPLARTDPDSPIAGMPILDVDKSRTVVVVKRSLSPGFAGLHNPLFKMDNCLMLFGDGKKAMLDLATALKEG